MKLNSHTLLLVLASFALLVAPRSLSGEKTGAFEQSDGAGSASPSQSKPRPSNSRGENHEQKPASDEKRERENDDASGFARFVGLALKMENFHLQSRFVPGGIVIDGFSATIAGGRLEGTGSINTADSDGPQHLRVQITNCDIPQLLEVLGVRLRVNVNGRISGTLEGAWRGFSEKNMRPSMQGRASLLASGGTITGMKLIDKLAEKSGIDELRNFAYNSFRIEATATSGEIRVSQISIRGPRARLDAKGNVDLASEKMSGSFQVYAAPDLAAGSEKEDVRAVGDAIASSPGAKRDENNLVALPVPIALEGTLQKPHAKADLEHADADALIPAAAALLDAKLQKKAQDDERKQRKKEEKRQRAMQQMDGTEGR